MGNDGTTAGRPAPQARARLGVGAPPALIAAGVLAHGTAFGTFGDDSEPEAAADCVMTIGLGNGRAGEYRLTPGTPLPTGG
jgi:hypothetical protein